MSAHCNELRVHFLYCAVVSRNLVLIEKVCGCKVKDVKNLKALSVKGFLQMIVLMSIDKGTHPFLSFFMFVSPIFSVFANQKETCVIVKGVAFEHLQKVIDIYTGQK